MNRNDATGPGVFTPDGCAVELYKRFAARGEAEIVDRALPPGADVLELGAGAGRVTRGLIALGRSVTAVDVSPEMLAEISGATLVCADIVGLDLGRRYGGVMLGSCLFNVADDSLRRSFVETCARHVSRNGSVFLECHASDALERAKPGRLGFDPSGIEVAWREVVRDGPIVRGTLEYRLDGSQWTHTFEARIFTPDEIAAELVRGGLRLVRRIDANWFEAEPIADGR